MTSLPACGPSVQFRMPLLSVSFRPISASRVLAEFDIIGIVNHRFLVEFGSARIETAGPTAQEGAAHDGLGNAVAVGRIAQRLAEAQVAEQLADSLVAVVLGANVGRHS